jgi:hypothetical protein
MSASRSAGRSLRYAGRMGTSCSKRITYSHFLDLRNTSQ